MLFLHNSYGTPELPDFGNLVGAAWMENLRWANTEPSMHVMGTNTDPSIHFRKAKTDPPMHFRRADTEYLLPVLLPTLLTTSLQSLLPFLKHWPSVLMLSISQNVHPCVRLLVCLSVCPPGNF